MDDQDEVDELEAMTIDFLDSLDADPEIIEAMRTLWLAHFELERRSRRLH